jgi:IS30 family transposase
LQRYKDHTPRSLRRWLYERDLLAVGKNCYIATLVERHSRFLLLIKVPSKDRAAVVTAVNKRVRKLPATLRRSLTWGLCCVDRLSRQRLPEPSHLVLSEQVLT